MPGHGRRRGDINQSLSICIGRRGQLLLYCHGGCAIRDVWRAMNRITENGAIEPVRAARLARTSTSARAVALWSRSNELGDSAAKKYLLRRGIATSSKWIRSFSRCRYPLPPHERFDGLIAAFSDPGETVSSVHRIYLSPDGSKAPVPKPKMSLGPIGASAIRVREPVEILGLAEGIETAMSAEILFGVPTWAAGGAALHRITLPPGVRKVIIFADNDTAGTTAALRAAREIRRAGLKVEIHLPTQVGTDWNDVLMDRASNAS